MTTIQPVALRAYSLFFSRHGTEEPFTQSELEWIVSSSMRKKIFASLVHAGWLKKATHTTYICEHPDVIFRNMNQFKVPEIMKNAAKPYAFVGMSAIEIWSDYSYIQRSVEKSPYFIEVEKKDITAWKQFLSVNTIPYYINKGTTIGEYVIIIPVKHVLFEEKDDVKVESLRETMKEAAHNNLYAYAHAYMKKKYGAVV